MYPDVGRSRWIDVPEDARAKRRYLDAFAELVEVRGLPQCADGEDLPALRFAPDAQELYQAWFEANQERAADAGLPPALQAHYAKYQSLVPSLALIHELASGGRERISMLATEAAVGIAGYLAEHAKRIYGLTAEVANPAAVLAEHVQSGALGGTFTRRSVARRMWSGLGTNDAVDDALRQLESAGWIRRRTPTTRGPGRPPIEYEVNPAVIHA